MPERDDAAPVDRHPGGERDEETRITYSYDLAPQHDFGAVSVGLLHGSFDEAEVRALSERLAARLAAASEARLSQVVTGGAAPSPREPLTLQTVVETVRRTNEALAVSLAGLGDAMTQAARQTSESLEQLGAAMLGSARAWERTPLPEFPSHEEWPELQPLRDAEPFIVDPAQDFDEVVVVPGAAYEESGEMLTVTAGELRAFVAERRRLAREAQPQPAAPAEVDPSRTARALRVLD